MKVVGHLGLRIERCYMTECPPNPGLYSLKDIIKAFTKYAVVISVIVFGIFLNYWVWNPYDDIGFSKSDWQDDFNRLGMVDDLRANHLYTGQSKRSIIELLGPPRKIYSYRPKDRSKSTHSAIQYYVGGDMRTSMFGMDDVLLMLYFDKDDCLIETEIIGH